MSPEGDKSGGAACYLTTFAGLDAARHLYETAGFVLEGESDADPWGGGVREQRFRRARFACGTMTDTPASDRTSPDAKCIPSAPQVPN